MLLVAFVNKSNLADVSDYNVDVWINQTHIAGPFKVKGHKRADGWLELVKQFVIEQEVLETRGPSGEGREAVEVARGVKRAKAQRSI